MFIRPSQFRVIVPRPGIVLVHHVFLPCVTPRLPHHPLLRTCVNLFRIAQRSLLSFQLSNSISSFLPFPYFLSLASAPYDVPLSPQDPTTFLLEKKRGKNGRMSSPRLYNPLPSFVFLFRPASTLSLDPGDPFNYSVPT